MNIYDNIKQIGNYRFRPQSTDPSDLKYNMIPNNFDAADSGNYYTNATDADVVIDGGFDDLNQPMSFVAVKDKVKMLYSLEDCFKRFRPRSGINKATYLNNMYLHHSNSNMFKRPRYYMSDKNDNFKYWTSYRTEGGREFGIANTLINAQNYISDVSPYIVYKERVPTNRIVVKMQTHVGDIDLGPFSSSSGSFSDPLYGDSNKRTPVRWKVQSLDETNNWIDIISFNQSSTRKDGTSIIKHDGYVELGYGLQVPDKYLDVFVKAEELSSITMRPETSVNGYAYLIKSSTNDVGVYHIWFNNQWEQFVPEYGWSLEEETVDRLTNFVTTITDPIKYTDTSNNKSVYREFQFINGLRVVVETMSRVNSTLDLIELSPRLTVDLSDRTIDYKINKVGSDLGISGLPVGQLLSSIGNISIFDYDQSFNENNSSSIISKYLNRNIQLKFYEVVIDVEGYDYFVPMKTMYFDGFPSTSFSDRTVSMQLKDMFFYFESITAPQILATNVTVSYAISLLLDSIGFSNYAYKRVNNENEVTIPYFFVQPDTSVAEVLNDLARSTQTAMFFDEYNNFVMMSKNYMMPSSDDRSTDIVLYGSKDFNDLGVIENNTTNAKLSNIINVASQQTEVFNDGSINYSTRYIQKTYGTIKQASLIDKEKTWIYKPVLLWEVSGTENTKSVNDQSGNQSDYVLSAIPLNSTLSSSVPTVSNNSIINNTMDLGEGVYWITRYNGYFYANAEIIKYDAVQYSITDYGNVWITSVQDYQNYFSKLRHNGKMYPTGLVRIYSKPYYEVISGVTKLKTGAVEKHGRGQFGTSVVQHDAGLNSYWSDNTNVRGCNMRSEMLFSLDTTDSLNSEALAVGLDNGSAGVDNELAKQTTRLGTIKNFLTLSYDTETATNSNKSTQTGTIQSSAFIMNGPAFTTTQRSIDFVSYVYKPLDNRYKHFGTRMRVIGKIENSENRGQTPIGSTTYFVATGNTPNQNINVSGGSGGLAVMIDPSTNAGYYFEIAALTENNISNYNASAENLHNIFFYKTMRATSDVVGTEIKQGDAVPVKLWGGLSNIIVDDGNFTGQYRMVGEEHPTVYDLAVEYEDIGNMRRFYLFINNRVVATVDDPEPLPVHNNMALFVRGSARCMFEHVYALTNNYSQNTVFALDTPTMSAINDSEINANESFRKYAMSGIIQNTYLSGISPAEPPKYNMYFDEFGTIMREASYFNVRYDKAYPALYAQMSPTFNKIKGYVVSGFRAGSYGAEFLVFNSTDTALSLDSSSGNYLRIQGITFTQESNHEYSVDDYFSKNSDFSNPVISGNTLVKSPLKYDSEYNDIKVSRMTYGKRSFSLDATYVQTQDDAQDLMSWIISKIMKPRKSVGLEIFSMPTIQLGDVVEVDYKDNENVEILTNSRYVVYNIEYSRDQSGPSMSIYLSEVV